METKINVMHSKAGSFLVIEQYKDLVFLCKENAELLKKMINELDLSILSSIKEY